MNRFFRALVRAPVELLRLLLLFLLILLRALWVLLAALFGRYKPQPKGERCPCPDKIPEHVRRRPDPCLYSQSYLMQKGIPVTWDNPDIWLTELDGTVVGSGSLQAAHKYLLHARIWNASFSPALGVSVRSKFRNFGINASVFEPVESTAGGVEVVRFINVAGWGHSVAVFNWTTPDVPGHYCIQVECAHPDDLNTANNVGQENTTVVATSAGRTISFPIAVFNPFRQPARVVLRFDSYEIPDREWRMPIETRQIPLARSPGFLVPRGADAKLGTLRGWLAGKGIDFTYRRYIGRSELFKAQRQANRSLPEGWKVHVDGAGEGGGLILEGLEERELQVTISAPVAIDGIRQLPINISAWIPDEGPLGGLTVTMKVG